MQFTVSNKDDVYLFEIEETYNGWAWAYYDIGVCMFDRDGFASAADAQQDAIAYAKADIVRRGEQEEAANDARGEERAGQWEYETSRL